MLLSDFSAEKRNVYLLLCLGCITISFNVAAITAVIPVISQDLFLSDLLVSKIIPYYMIPYGLGALIYAPLTRFFSYRKVLALSMFLFACACFICARTSSLNHLLLGRIAMGISGAGAIPLGLMIIGENYEKHKRGRLVGLFFSCSFFASLAGLALSGLASWRWLFYCPAMLAVLMMCGCVFLKVKCTCKVRVFIVKLIV